MNRRYKFGVDPPIIGDQNFCTKKEVDIFNRVSDYMSELQNKFRNFRRPATINSIVQQHHQPSTSSVAPGRRHSVSPVRISRPSRSNAGSSHSKRCYSPPMDLSSLDKSFISAPEESTIIASDDHSTMLSLSTVNKDVSICPNVDELFSPDSSPIDSTGLSDHLNSVNSPSLLLPSSRSPVSRDRPNQISRSAREKIEVLNPRCSNLTRLMTQPPAKMKRKDFGNAQRDDNVDAVDLLNQISSCSDAEPCVIVAELDKASSVSSISVFVQAASQWSEWKMLSDINSQRAPVQITAYRRVFHRLIHRGLIGFNLKALLLTLVSADLLAVRDLEMADCTKLFDIGLAEWMLDPDAYSSSEGSDPTGLMHESASIRAASKIFDRYQHLKERLESSDLSAVFRMESQIIPVLVEMEVTGLFVDAQKLDILQQLLSRKISEIEREANQVAGSPLLLSSHQQLRKILYDKLHLDEKLSKHRMKTTCKGHEKSTSESVLKQLTEVHPLPSLVLQHRQLSKLHSTEMVGLRAYLRDDTIHASWEQTSANTGRLQSAKPNLQAITKSPVEWIEDGTAISVYSREIFRARPDHEYVVVDFKQMEFRILAHLSEDPKILSVFADEQTDIFKALSSMWLKKGIDVVTDEDRERTKRIVYSVMYGVGRIRLAEYLQVTPLEAQSIISRFLKEFPGITKFVSHTIALCRQTGESRSILNRRRILPNLKCGDFTLRSQAERQAVNFRIQGSAADICKIAMVKVSEEIHSSGIKAKMLLQIHDEILLEVRKNDTERLKVILLAVMECNGGAWQGDLKLKVPLRITLKTGHNWAQMV